MALRHLTPRLPFSVLPSTSLLTTSTFTTMHSSTPTAHSSNPTRIHPFSTSTSLLAKSAASRLRHLHADIPPYPHGPSQWYKQSNFGLYGNAKIQYGNVVSANMGLRSRRKWKPNVRQKRLWSEALGKNLRIRVTARALRTIKKSGGLDNYLLGESKARIRELGMGGWLLRWRVMQTEGVRKRWEEERRALGLPMDEGGDGEGEGEKDEDGDREIERASSERGEEGDEWEEEIVLGDVGEMQDGDEGEREEGARTERV